MLSGQHLKWVVGVLTLMVLGLFVAVIIFAIEANSKACRDGLLAEQECNNVTSILEVQLTQTQEVLQRTQAQAATYNETVVTLLASLERKEAQSQELLAKEEELRGEIEELKRKLQNALLEVERLRKGNEASGKENETASASSSPKALSPLLVPLHLLLVVGVLLA
ncbi:bone marrow stromal antigen 2 [Crocuta crocuta]